MFTMSQHQYAYAAAAPAPRQYSAHATSSAFSSSANPDEDWTKISDLAERRRIQNRIAQRNYRKKLKRRLEDLERRANTDGTPITDGKKNSSSSKRAAPAQKAQKSQAVQPPAPPKTLSQFTPPMHHDDEYLFPPAAYDERERSHTPPFMAPTGYAYPNPEDTLLMAPYGSPEYRPMTTTATYPDYIATTVPISLPSMTHFSDAIKRENVFPGSDDSLSYMHYGYMPGMGVNSAAAAPYDHSNPHTPPLSHSFDHSTNCSETGYEYPTTPLSMPSPPETPALLRH